MKLPNPKDIPPGQLWEIESPWGTPYRWIAARNDPNHEMPWQATGLEDIFSFYIVDDKIELLHPYVGKSEDESITNPKEVPSGEVWEVEPPENTQGRWIALRNQPDHDTPWRLIGLSESREVFYKDQDIELIRPYTENVMLFPNAEDASITPIRKVEKAKDIK